MPSLPGRRPGSPTSQHLPLLHSTPVTEELAGLGRVPTYVLLTASHTRKRQEACHNTIAVVFSSIVFPYSNIQQGLSKGDVMRHKARIHAIDAHSNRMRYGGAGPHCWERSICLTLAENSPLPTFSCRYRQKYTGGHECIVEVEIHHKKRSHHAVGIIATLDGLLLGSYPDLYNR